MIFPTLTAVLVAQSTSLAASLAPPLETAIEPQSSAETEYFLISAPASAGAAGQVARGGAGEGQPIAAVACRVIERDGEAKEFLLEREIVFAEGGLRIRHTETGRGSERRLVWREFLPSASRTWVADWTAGERGAEVRSIAYGWNRPIHESVMSRTEVDRSIFGPLEVLHGMRTGVLACGDVGGVLGVIDPSSAAVIDVDRTTVAVGSELVVDLRRPDGSLLMGADIDGSAEAFTSLRLSDQEAVTRRIERAEFDRLNRRWTVESRRPYNAMLALIPKRR